MKLRIFVLALLAILGLPALASAETTQVAVNVPADLLDHVLDALISGGLVAIGWAVSHWRIIKRVASIGTSVSEALSHLEGQALPTKGQLKEAAVEQTQAAVAATDPEAVVRLFLAKFSEWDALAKSLAPVSTPAQAIATPAPATAVIPAAPAQA